MTKGCAGLVLFGGGKCANGHFEILKIVDRQPIGRDARGLLRMSLTLEGREQPVVLAAPAEMWPQMAFVLHVTRG